MHLGSQTANRFNEFGSCYHLVQTCFDPGESFPCLRSKFFKLCGSGFHLTSIIRNLAPCKRRTAEKHDNARRPL